MQISKRRIRNATSYMRNVPEGAGFRVVARPNEQRLRACGFDPAPAVGTTLLPAIVGPTTRFNALGRFQPNKNLPKVERYTGSRSWTRRQYHGQDFEEVTDTVYYHRLCYQGDLVPPPSLEVSVQILNDETVVTAPREVWHVNAPSRTLHAINLMLELFGSCEIMTEDFAQFDDERIRRVNWAILPPGQDLFPQIRLHIARIMRGRKPDVERVIVERQATIFGYCPSQVFQGEAGFNDYIAYVFEDRGLVVLESVKYGNALYIVGEDWQGVSQRSKAEIINEGLHLNRIVHSEEWRARLADAMRIAA